MASSFYPGEFDNEATFCSEVKNLKSLENHGIINGTNNSEKVMIDENSIKRSETIVSIEAATETDSAMGLPNTRDESLDILNAFGNLKMSPTVSTVYDLIENDDSSEIFNIKEMEKSPQTESITKPFVETNTVYQNRQKFDMGNLNISIQNMYGNVYMNSPLKKLDVSNPDGMAYSESKINGGRLLNSVALDKDIQFNWMQVCTEFDIQTPPVEPNNKYDFLYDNFKSYLMANNQITRYQFLFRLSRVADITHLCQI